MTGEKLSANQKVGLIAWCAFMAFCAVGAGTANMSPSMPPVKLHCETRP